MSADLSKARALVAVAHRPPAMKRVTVRKLVQCVLEVAVWKSEAECIEKGLDS